MSWGDWKSTAVSRPNADQFANDLIGDGLLVGRRDLLCYYTAIGLAANYCCLFAQRLLQNSSVAGDDVLVWLHQPGDQRFAQSQRGVNDHFRSFAIQRVGGKQNAGCLTGNHFLYNNGQGDIVMADTVSCPVADGPRRPQTAPAIDDRFEQGHLADDIEKGILLSGKRHIG